MMWLIAVWVVGFVVCMWTLISWWRRDLDVGMDDMLFFIFSSILGPISIGVAIYISIVRLFEGININSSKVVIKRKER